MDEYREAHIRLNDRREVDLMLSVLSAAGTRIVQSEEFSLDLFECDILRKPSADAAELMARSMSFVATTDFILEKPSSLCVCVRPPLAAP